jgi:sugar phosphate isomerase/epimerase
VRLNQDGFFQLTYCTNIHPSNGWDDVLATLERFAPALKKRFAPDAPFGIGLRLSGVESRELLEGDRLARFRAWLDEQDLYVSTLNGFPYGPFHRQPVKADVHAPDWRDEERVRYTLRLVEILAALLPPGMAGGISTSPLSYKDWVDAGDPATWELLTRNVARVAAAMARLHRDGGPLVHLDIEPEPDGLLGTCADLVGFYEEHLLPDGAPLLVAELGIPVAEAGACLLEHVRVCFDACHLAVAYEDPAQVLDRFAGLGIKVGKVQVSSAVKAGLPADPAARAAIGEALAPFAESTYLHQVVRRDRDGTLVHYPDLPQALPALGAPEAAEWRVHFHVPIFVERFGDLASTQDDLRRVLALLRQRRFADQLEIETYTWGVLPPALKTDLEASIAREYAWVLDVF